MSGKLLTLIATAAFVLSAPFADGAEAGGKILQFGGPLGSFKAQRHAPSSSYSAHHKKAKALKSLRAEAAAKKKALAKKKAAAQRRAIAAKEAEAKRKALAEARAEAKQKTLAKAQSDEKRKTVAKTETAEKRVDAGGDTATADVDVPSTAVLLTRQDIAQDGPSAPNDTTAQETASDAAATAKYSETSPTASETAMETAEAPDRGTASAQEDPKPVEPGDATAGCKHFVPAVGLTISVDC